jgi:hypothetical protein
MNEDKFEDAIRDFCRARQDQAHTTPQFDGRVLQGAKAARQATQPKSSAQAESNVRRFFMRNKTTSLAAAAIVVVAVVLGISIFHEGAAPAYAVDQTVAAIKEIKTVYMAGEFYLQGKFECWMRFDGNPDRPTHVWLGREGHWMSKICSPDGVFGLNKRTNRIHFATRDERGMAWIPKFGRLFDGLVTKAKKTDAIKISNRVEPDGREMLVVRIETPKRVQEFVVDPNTKLPIRFTTVRDDAPQEMMRTPLAVKHLTEIRYNETPPAGIFARSADATVVEQEVDCWVDPDSGLAVGEMTHEEACRELVNQACQAMIDVNETRLQNLALFYRLWPDQLWQQVRQMKEAGQWVQDYKITGEPYPEGDVWFLPTELKLASDKTEVQTVMIKFYTFDGNTRCFSIGSKEKGVVD